MNVEISGSISADREPARLHLPERGGIGEINRPASARPDADKGEGGTHRRSGFDHEAETSGAGVADVQILRSADRGPGSLPVSIASGNEAARIRSAVEHQVRVRAQRAAISDVERSPHHRVILPDHERCVAAINRDRSAVLRQHSLRVHRRAADDFERTAGGGKFLTHRQSRTAVGDANRHRI